MKILLFILITLISGYFGYCAGRKAVESIAQDSTYDYHGEYNPSNGTIVSVNNYEDFIKAFTMTIFSWIDINEYMGKDYVEIFIGRDNTITVERYDINTSSQYTISLLYKNIRYACWCAKRNNTIVWYDEGSKKLDMCNTSELLEWFCKEGVISWRTKKQIV